MSVPNEQQIREAIQDILKNADLSSLSSKKVRKSLEEKFSVDLTAKKQQIDDILMKLINADDNNQSEEDNKSANGNDEFSDDNDEKPTVHNSSNGYSAASSKTTRRHRSSAESSDGDDDSKQPVIKKQKVNSTKNNSKPKGTTNESSDDEVDDEALARKLHEEELGVRPRSSKKPEKKTKKSTKAEKGKTTSGRKGNSLYSQACVLSEELASVMGTDKMARKDVVSRMWQIFKERNLMDPKNKQYVICDEQLEKVFKTKKFKAFGMMKILKNHIKDAKLVQS